MADSATNEGAGEGPDVNHGLNVRQMFGEFY